MSELNTELLDRIKDEVAIEKHGAAGWHSVAANLQFMLWPEVCRRYAEEVLNNKSPEIKRLTKQNLALMEEISQLKKQVEERNERIEDLEKFIEIQKSKLIHYAVSVCPEQDAEIQRRDIKIADLERDIKQFQIAMSLLWI